MGFIGNLSPQWIEAQYRLWCQSPEMVNGEWRAFFEGFNLSECESRLKKCLDPRIAMKHSAVHSLIHRYREIGHLLACTDPLSPCPLDHPLLSITAFGLEPADLETIFYIDRSMKPAFMESGQNLSESRGATLREIVDSLRETYCRSIGVEFMHIHDSVKREWLLERMETTHNRSLLSAGERLDILSSLREANQFELFLNKKFTGQTRFSLEGGEVLIPQLRMLVNRAAGLGITDLILGMPHRGRLNVLTNVFGRPLENIFAEFSDNARYGVVGEGDVKYHRGYSTDLDLSGGGRIHLALATNPSHLEAIDPVVIGKCRARQDRYGRGAAPRVLPVLIHGDAAFSGQGIVAETFNLSELSGYRVGGTLHIVLNNQIGFTTLPTDARSSLYSTDAAKMVMAPIFHVHGEDPDAVIHATLLALEYRQTFGCDVVVEVICYRRRGHNEGDEPYFTQPLMYEKINNRPPVHELYADRLREMGVGEDAADGAASGYQERLDYSLTVVPAPVDRGFDGEWSQYGSEFKPFDGDTGIDEDLLKELAKYLKDLPDGFNPHPKISALLNRRYECVEKGENIDWGTAESLAFATLLKEGISIRLSGQDVGRGTFSQRHSILYDMDSEDTYTPFRRVIDHGSEFQVYNSMLSENAVLGFEHGYSLEAPNCLVIWEAQYGDFANGAQVVIDEFIMSSEAKWNRANGLTMLLPHGMEGQGPDHSSARPERFLQLCAENNVQFTFPSTPAQYFHLLRRQVKQPFRKPLVILTPKGMLRHPLCTSGLYDFAKGRFMEVLPGSADPKKVESVLICSGKIYFELLERKNETGREDMDLVRVEQFYPLRQELLIEALARYERGTRFAWVQEEPENMGGWNFIRHHLADILGSEPAYVGRAEAASPAVGSHRLHKEEQARIIEKAFGLSR
jgi:2-oxoglutarate dehydrogenase E1 component